MVDDADDGQVTRVFLATGRLARRDDSFLEGREIAEGHITPAILDEIEQPSPEEFMQQDSADDLMPMRGISIGD